MWVWNSKGKIKNSCIKLIIFRPNIDDKGINKLGEAFVNLHNLNYVKFDLSQCENISNEGITKLSRVLSKLDNLSHFEMNLWW